MGVAEPDGFCGRLIVAQRLTPELACPISATPRIKLGTGTVVLTRSLVRSSCELSGSVYLGSERFRRQAT